MKKILIVDDDPLMRKSLLAGVSGVGYDLWEASSGKEALNIIKSRVPDLIITDYSMPGMNGLELIMELDKMGTMLPVIMLTGYGDLSLTIRSIQRGVYEYLEKPVDPSLLKSTIKKALESVERSKSLPEVVLSGESAKKGFGSFFFAGKNPRMNDVVKNIGRVSGNRVNILVEGETGTGKELVAHLIHNSGITRDRPMVVVNCSALTETLLESELFGHVKGSFTDSIRDKKGKFEMAADGTIFLDEISEISHNIQIKLLRVIQEQEFEKVGGEETIPMKARIIAATNKNLEELVHKGLFREDLYYRLKVFTISLPPLRERLDDMEELLLYLVDKHNRRYDKNITKIEDGVVEKLRGHNWPGNVRELENTVLQAMFMSRYDVLENRHIILSHSPGQVSQSIFSYGSYVSLEELEKDYIQSVLNHVDWNKVAASEILKISRPTLNNKIERYNISKD